MMGSESCVRGHGSGLDTELAQLLREKPGVGFWGKQDFSNCRIGDGVSEIEPKLQGGRKLNQCAFS